LEKHKNRLQFTTCVGKGRETKKMGLRGKSEWEKKGKEF